ncbi:hypothetical protein ISN44_As07g026520 [Arabidopsis suecica]|uniref:K-box domain-containing protein n=1 Tax=Arabidopsis suecica TaxID=45249 RepID=A0A8T2C024_ARASU|nr:hypothetical protein ISN44_As07g026520 [Arabidopsis suecica]
MDQAVERASLGCAMVSYHFFARSHFFQDLSWSNRCVSARVCRSHGFLCVGLFALRTAYSHTPEASVHSENEMIRIKEGWSRESHSNANLFLDGSIYQAPQLWSVFADPVGEDLEPMNFKDLQNLEQQLETALKQTLSLQKREGDT